MATTVTPCRTLMFVFVLVIVWSNTCMGDTIPECEKGSLEVDEGSTLHLTCPGRYTWYRQRDRSWYNINRCSQSDWQACYSYKYTDSGDSYTALAVTGNLMNNIAGTVGCGYLSFPSTITLLAQCNIYVVYPASKVRNCGLQWNTQDWTVSGSCEVDKLSHFDSSVFQCQWHHWPQSGRWNKNIVTTRKINKAGSTCSFSGYQMETSYGADDIGLSIYLGSGWMFANSISIRLPVITEADQQGLIRVKENRKVNLICFVTGLYATRRAYSLDFHCSHMVNSSENRTAKPHSILWNTLTFAPNVHAHNGIFCTCAITWGRSRTAVKTTSAQLIVETETRTETNVPTVPWSVTTVLPTKSTTITPYRPTTISISTSEHRHSTTPERIIVVSKKDDRNGAEGDSDGPPVAVIAVVAGLGLLFLVVVVVIVFLVKQKRGKNKHDPKTTTGRNDDFVEYHNDMFVDADTFQPTQANSLVRSRNDFQSPDGVFPFGPQDVSLEEETSYFAISLARSGPSISQNVDRDLHPLAEGNENNATISILATSSGTQPQTRDEYAVVRKPKSKRNSDPQHNDYAVVNKTRSNQRQALSRPSDPKTGNTSSSSSQELYTQVKKKSKGSNPVGNQQLQAEGEIFSPTQKLLSSARDPATDERAIATAAMAMKSKQTGAEYENMNEIVDQRGQVKKQDWKAPADVDDDYNTLNFHRMAASQPSGERDSEYSHIGAMGYRD